MHVTQSKNSDMNTLLDFRINPINILFIYNQGFILKLKIENIWFIDWVQFLTLLSENIGNLFLKTYYKILKPKKVT